jgi:hypothetical protein
MPCTNRTTNLSSRRSEARLGARHGARTPPRAPANYYWMEPPQPHTQVATRDDQGVVLLGPGLTAHALDGYKRPSAGAIMGVGAVPKDDERSKEGVASKDHGCRCFWVC